MHRHRHNIAEVFPRQSDLPQTATQEDKINLFLKLFRQPTDLVICEICGALGHYIKSRRGGIRWHITDDSEHRKRTLETAAECWKMVGHKPPKFVTSNFG